MNNFGQPYYMPQQYGSYQPTQQFMQQPIQTIPKMQPTQQFMQLQGKLVDSIDVVKAMDISLDGSITYFPLTDGTAIVTKQLQQDGTSKTIIYKPIEAETPIENVKYITMEDLNKAMKRYDNNEFKEDLKMLKRKIKELTEDIKDINEYISKGKE